jgi:nucleotide-binding universal stress UspA family protein
MSTFAIPSIGPNRVAVRDNWRGRIVVATDGRTPSDNALVAAHALAGRSAFAVISVIAEAASKDRTAGWGRTPETPGAHYDLVQAQVHRVLGDSADAWIEVRRGYPPAVLASYAESHRAALLIAGLGRAGVLDRLLGDESALRLARMAQTPFYAVAAGRPTPPQRIVVATDFTATSMRAARLALALASPCSEILLAHVCTPAGRVASEGSLRRQAELLQDGFSGRVRGVELRGDAASELLGFAKERDADAIALGAHGHGAVVRCTMGPVATRVVRCAPCSILLAPA